MNFIVTMYRVTSHGHASVTHKESKSSDGVERKVFGCVEQETIKRVREQLDGYSQTTWVQFILQPMPLTCKYERMTNK